MPPPEPKKFKLPGAGEPSVTPAVVKTFSERLGISEEEALKVMEDILGHKIEVVTPDEPFIVVVTKQRILPTSRSVKCSLCESECWAAEEYGPLATYLCMDCSQNSV